MDGTITFDMDYLVHSAPQPSFLSKYLALVYPFDLVTWAALVGSIFFVGFILYLLGKMQKVQYKFLVWYHLILIKIWPFFSELWRIFVKNELQGMEQHVQFFVVHVRNFHRGSYYQGYEIGKGLRFEICHCYLAHLLLDLVSIICRKFEGFFDISSAIRTYWYVGTGL